MQFHSYSNEEGRNIIVTDSLMHPEDNGTTLDIRRTEHELRKLMEKEMKLKWDIVSLSDYWREGRIPRGLRVKKLFPSTTRDAPFKEKWEAILNKCSMDLMLLLIEDHKKQREELGAKITQIESSLTLTPEQKVPFFKKISDDIHKTEVTIKELKRTKFERDVEDYQHGHVYNWERPPRTPRTPHHSKPGSKTGKRGPASRSVSFNLTTSMDEEMVSNHSTDQDPFLDQDSQDWPPLQPNTTDRGRVGVDGGGGAQQQQQQQQQHQRQQQQRAPAPLTATTSRPQTRDQPRKYYR